MKIILNEQIKINRLEFLVTYKCTSKCDHCSVYHKTQNTSLAHLEVEKAIQLINEACDSFEIDSLMTFGGEPLLYPEFVCQLHKTGFERNIKTRQIITNGYWSNKKERINEICKMINIAHVNNVLVSIDTFHEKYLDYSVVQFTLEQIKNNVDADISLHPVWVVDKEHKNPFNDKTHTLLNNLKYLGLNVDDGNNLFAAGRAIENLSEYLPKSSKSIKGTCKDVPYADMPNDIRSLNIDPDGNVYACNVIGNINDKSLTDIIKCYDYSANPILNTMVEQGADGLYEFAEQNGIKLNVNGYYSLCELCKDISKKYLTTGSSGHLLCHDLC